MSELTFVAAPVERAATGLASQGLISLSGASRARPRPASSTAVAATNSVRVTGRFLFPLGSRFVCLGGCSGGKASGY